MADGIETRGNADQIDLVADLAGAGIATGENELFVAWALNEILGLQIAKIGIRVFPLVERLADNFAGWRAHGLALNFADQHLATKEAAQIAVGVTLLQPANRRAAGANGGQVLLGFGRVVPDELAVKVPGFDIDIEGQGLDRDEAFQRVHLRADRKGVEIIGVGADAANHLGIAGARLVAHAGDQPARLLDADGFNQLAADGG